MTGPATARNVEDGIERARRLLRWSQNPLPEDMANRYFWVQSAGEICKSVLAMLDAQPREGVQQPRSDTDGPGRSVGTLQGSDAAQNGTEA